MVKVNYSKMSHEEDAGSTHGWSHRGESWYMPTMSDYQGNECGSRSSAKGDGGVYAFGHNKNREQLAFPQLVAPHKIRKIKARATISEERVNAVLVQRRQNA